MKFNIKDLLKRKKGENSEEEQINILGKVGDFFDPEPEKERVLNQEDFKGAGDVYYASVSAFYKIAERLLWIVLAVFLTFSLATNYKEITYDNFFYLLRDFSAAADSNTSNYQILSYDSDDRQKFDLYKGGLVSASPSTVSIFTAGGRRTLRNNNDYYSPNVLCCDKYVLVYDTAASSFSMYNSFSKIHNETLSGPITDACFNEEGAFALAVRQNDIKTVIYLYSDDIKLRGSIPDKRFVFDMSLNGDQSRFAALYYEAGDGTGLTSVCVYDVKSSASARMLKEIELNGEFPLACSFLDNGGIAVITNRSLRIYDKNFNEKAAEDFGKSKISAFEASREGATVVVGEGIRKNVLSFDKKGNMIYDGGISENVSAVTQTDGFIFARTVSGVIRIDASGDKREFLPSDSGKMLVYDKDTAIVCGEARAEYLVFGKKK